MFWERIFPDIGKRGKKVVKSPHLATKWAMPAHRVFIHDALIALFETPVLDNNTIGIDFGKTIFDFKENTHLSPLSKPGVAPVVWETKLKPSTRTVLNPVETEGQELLLDFLVVSDSTIYFFWYSSGMYSVFRRFYR